MLVGVSQPTLAARKQLEQQITMAKQICFSCLCENRLCSRASPALQMPYSLQGNQCSSERSCL